MNYSTLLAEWMCGKAHDLLMRGTGLDQSTEKHSYPGGSRKRVSKAGAAIREGRASQEDLAIIDIWRAAHRPVLNTFQAILRTRARGKGVIVAQRHKRKNTIFDKLQRLPSMELARMDDIAGCRLIFENLEDLRSFRKDMHSARFHHKRRNEDDKYDYIKSPKKTGYRGIHDVYIYDVNSSEGEKCRGLYIEIQYRTKVQHAWSTAVEVIGHITQSQPKFQKGDKRYEEVMCLASEILARVYENENSCVPELTNEQLLKRFLEKDEEIGLLQILRGLNSSKISETKNRNAILIFGDNNEITVRTFRDATSALRQLFTIENEYPGRDVVLVRADTSGEVREAFKNYFSDAGEFINLIDGACRQLSRKESVHMDAQSFFKMENGNFRKK